MDKCREISLYHYLKPYKKSLILGPLFKLFEAAVELLLPFFLARLIDEGLRRGEAGPVWTYIGLMLLLVCAGAGAAFACQYMASVCSQAFARALREAGLKKVMEAEQVALERLGQGSILNRLTADINQIALALAMAIRLLSRAPFLCIGSLVCAFVLYPPYAWYMLWAVLLTSALLFGLMWLCVRHYRRSQTALDRLVWRVRDNLSGLFTLRAFSREEAERQNWTQENQCYSQESRRAGNYTALMNPFSTLIFNLLIALLVYLAPGALRLGDLSQGQLIAFINYLNQIVLAMMVVANLVILYPRAYTAQLRLKEVLALESEAGAQRLRRNSEPGGRKRCQEEPGRPAPLLRVAGLSYRYPGAQAPALEDLDFCLAEGESLGLIGSTGAGKSTLLRLIQGLDFPERGAIYWRGQTLCSMDLSQLRQSQAVVPQQSQLLAGSLRENLCLGLPADKLPSESELWSALEAAQAADFVRDRGGLDQPVETGGANYSGGQRQRLAVARALLRPAELYLLDSASSALDYRTEKKLMQGLAQRLEGKALICISQRVHCVRGLGRILVLDQGRPVGLGSHQELLSSCQIYRELAASQMEEA